MRSRGYYKKITSLGIIGCAPFFLATESYAQTRSDPADQTAEELNEQRSDIIVTGTRSAGREALKSPVPIAVVDSEDLSRTGAENLAAQLQFSDVSVNYPRSATGLTSAGNRTLTLRGLSPDHTLVLVNGKRRHTSSLLNTASNAGRGSAPIDISVIPDSAIKRIEVLKDGAASLYGSDAIAGVINLILADENDGGMASLNIGQTDVGDGQTVTIDGRFTTGLAGGGFITVSAEGRLSGWTGRANVDSRVGRVASRWGDPKSSAVLAAVNAELPLGNGEAYAFGTIGTRKAQIWSHYQLTPVKFLPSTHYNVYDGQGTVGYRTNINNVSLDISNTFGYNRIALQADTINPTLFAIGQSPLTFDTGRARYWQDIVDVVATSELGMFERSSFSLGGQFRKENYLIKQGEPDALVGVGPFQAPLFNVPSEYKRTAYSVFGDLEISPTDWVDLTGALRYDHFSDFGSATTWRVAARVAPADWVALRGTVNTGFRAPSVQQSSYSAITTVATVNGLVQSGHVRPGSLEATALGGRALGAERSKSLGAGIVLTPAQGLSITADWYQIKINDRIVLSDVLGGSNSGAFVSAALANISLYKTVLFSGNFMDTKTTGFEIKANYSGQISSDDTIGITLGFGHNKQRATNIATNPAAGAPGYIVNFPIAAPKALYTIIGSQPVDRFLFAGEWEHGKLTLNVNVSYFGGYKAAPIDILQKFGARTLIDIGASYDILPSVTLGLGVRNIGDTYPTPYERSPVVKGVFGGGLSYGEDSPFGFNGRSYYATLSTRF